MDTVNDEADLARRIGMIEEAYEFFLSYAARGTDGRGEAGVEAGIRPTLEGAIAALDGLEQVARAETGPDNKPFHDWIDVLAGDVRKSLAGIRLVLAQPAISSQLVDNLNASIHLRALLTDLFVLDESVKASGRGKN